jgi:hypothetical protein
LAVVEVDGVGVLEVGVLELEAGWLPHAESNMANARITAEKLRADEFID